MEEPNPSQPTLSTGRLGPYTKDTAGVKNFEHSPDFDGVYYRRLMRWSSIKVAAWMKDTAITPNQITIFGFLITLPAFYFLMQGTYQGTVIGAFLGLLSYWLDYLDGSLARIRNSGNIYGQYLDMYCGRLGVLILYLGITIGVAKNMPTNALITMVWIAGFLAYTAALMNGSIYNSFHRLMAGKAREVIASEKKKQGLLPNFYYVEVFYYPLMFLFAMVNQMYWFLLFCAVYGWLFTLGTFFILGKAIKKASLEGKKE